ncbi:MAG TPA: transposase [bacterium]|nr:transposase [bacterium]
MPTGRQAAVRPLNPMQTQKPKRKPIRLREFDYSSPSDYFITICSHGRECIFGEIIYGEMVLNDLGKIVEEEILNTQKIRNNISIDIYSIMPNHIHLIMSILCDDRRGDPVDRPDSRATQRVAPTLKSDTIGSIIGQIKSISSKRTGINLFQRNYHEHIIRNDKSYDEIYTYIESNPQTWDRDRNHPTIYKS